MENKMDSPFKTQFELPRDGIIRQELITYEERGGVVVKITTIRNFQKNDYIDSQTIVPLMNYNNSEL
jgi:hypothetical protein